MLRNIISQREKELPVSTIGRMLKIAAESKSIISLGPGEPDFVSPPNVIRAARMGLNNKQTHYSPVAGRSDFKKAVISKLRRENGIQAGEENVIVTCGSTEAIMLALIATVDPGEGVMIPDPGFLSYKPTVEVLNGMPISIPLEEENGFQLDVDVMRKRIIPEKTRVLIINTPSNPTGTVLDKKVLEEVADFVVEHGLLVLSDEAYEKFVYGHARHVSMGSLNGMGKYVMTLQSFSKTYAMPGFRLGYACGPEEVVRAMTKLHVFSTLCAPTLSQVAGIEALRGPQGAVEKMRRKYDRRRRMIIKRIEEIPGWTCREPQGAFYAFPNVGSMGMKSLKASEWLLEHARVATIPGTEFGRMGEGFIRLSYATAFGKIEKAMDRIGDAVKKIGNNNMK
jgi:aminotransferase